MFNLLKEIYFKRYKALTQIWFCVRLTKPLWGMRVKLHLATFFFFFNKDSEQRPGDLLKTPQLELAESGHEIQVSCHKISTYSPYSLPVSQMHPQGPFASGMANHRWSGHGQWGQGCTLASSALIIWGMVVQSDPWYLELHPTYSSSVSSEERLRRRGVVRMRRRRRNKSQEVGRIVVNGQMIQKAEPDMKRTVRGRKKFSLTSLSDIKNLFVIHWIVYPLLPW